MSEEKDKVNAEALLKEAKENLEVAKDALADARTDVRDFKKKHKIRKGKAIEDEATKTELEELNEVAALAETEKTEAETAYTALKPAKGTGGGGGGAKYDYGQVKDAETGEMRDSDSTEKKRWRAHARKVVKKDDNEFTDPSQVPFDATWFDPKPKKEKKEKEEKKEEAPKEEPKADAKEEAKEEAPRRARRKK